ncbi:MAG: ABC transporter permease, partial [Candidatus Marinimicrobia bacterium]|nr:ABC transporter permease [Candidatus Neomarinimicrobiota bacterium]
MKIFKYIKSSPVGLTGLIIIVFFFFIAIFSDYITPHGPNEYNLRMRYLPPFWAGGKIEYFLGTDQLGRDMLSRLIYGSRISLIVGIGGVIVSMILGVFLGLICGFYRGITDAIISRIIDTLMSIPFILLAISIVGLVGITGDDSLLVIIIVLGLTGWITFARVVRGEVLSIREKEYIESAYAIGQKNSFIMFVHILPNVMPSIIVLSTLQIATVIIAESSLSFLGLGVKPPIVTWGSMLADGRDHLATSWWLATFPGIAITVTTLGLIMFGDWLRDYLDPKTKNI